MPANKRLPIDRFLELHAEIGQILERLSAAHEDHFDVRPEDVTWGHAANLEEIRNRLRHISDFVFYEGEFK